MLYQNSGSRPRDKKVEELGDRAHQKGKTEEIPRMVSKQNTRTTTTHQARVAGHQPRLERVQRDFLKMKLIDRISMSLSSFTIEEQSLVLD